MKSSAKVDLKMILFLNKRNNKVSIIKQKMPMMSEELKEEEKVRLPTQYLIEVKTELNCHTYLIFILFKNTINIIWVH